MATAGSLAALGDNWHNGVNNAGNKSFCSYRVGHGVPGYTGFIPVHENITVPDKKGVADRAPLSHGDNPHGDGGILVKPTTTFQADYSITPEDFAVSTQPNALWDIKANRPIGDPPFIRRPEYDGERPFLASTSFRTAYNDVGASQKYPENVTHLGQLRPPNTAPSGKKNPFMETEYMQKSMQIHRARKLVPSSPTPQAERANPDIEGVQLRNEAMTTSYRNDYGRYGMNPADSLPRDPTEISLRSSTAEQSMGTTKATYHLPGYSGFIPASNRNARAAAQSMHVQPREGTKKIELSTLGQYPQDIPGYGGYRPKTSINDVGPNRNSQLTTTGRCLSSGTNYFEPGDLGLSVSSLAQAAPQKSLYAKKSAIRQDLFSHESGNGAVSDNGRQDSDLYFSKTRPFEGRSVAIIKQGHWNQMY